jgi:hypothetical protein
VKVTLGGFIAAESVWRQHNMVNDIGTAFATTPYPFSPLYNEHEFHGTARQSRISLLVEGNIDPYQKLSGYYESDFLGVGQTSNYNQSNSWPISPMTTRVGEVGDFTSSPARPGAWRHRTRSI